MESKLTEWRRSIQPKGEPAFKNELDDADELESLLLICFRQMDARDQEALLTLATALASQYPESTQREIESALTIY